MQSTQFTRSAAPETIQARRRERVRSVTIHTFCNRCDRDCLRLTYRTYAAYYQDIFQHFFLLARVCVCVCFAHVANCLHMYKHHSAVSLNNRQIHSTRLNNNKNANHDCLCDARNIVSSCNRARAQDICCDVHCVSVCVCAWAHV